MYEYDESYKSIRNYWYSNWNFLKLDTLRNLFTIYFGLVGLIGLMITIGVLKLKPEIRISMLKTVSVVDLNKWLSNYNSIPDVVSLYLKNNNILLNKYNLLIIHDLKYVDILKEAQKGNLTNFGAFKRYPYDGDFIVGTINKVSEESQINLDLDYQRIKMGFVSSKSTNTFVRDIELQPEDHLLEYIAYKYHFNILGGDLLFPETYMFLKGRTSNKDEVYELIEKISPDSEKLKAYDYLRNSRWCFSVFKILNEGKNDSINTRVLINLEDNWPGAKIIKGTLEKDGIDCVKEGEHLVELNIPVLSPGHSKIIIVKTNDKYIPTSNITYKMDIAENIDVKRVITYLIIALLVTVVIFIINTKYGNCKNGKDFI